MIIEVYPVCLKCKHYDNEFPGHRCKAFDEIPIKIWEAENDHSEPLEEQDNEIVFEPIEEE